MTANQQNLTQWQVELKEKPVAEILRWAADSFPGQLVFATSLGLEDQVLTDLIARNNIAIPIFTLDTGRLFPETYELLGRTERQYGIKIEVYFPKAEAVEAMVNQHGINLFRESVELRKHCCQARKIEPLRRALAGRQAWIAGLRREQAVTRSELQLVEWDGGNGLFKINPLANWSQQDAWDYVHQNNVPYNPLHAQNFPSIGCACCTRAIKTGEDVRAGRWWWESPEHKECGLHNRK